MDDPRSILSPAQTASELDGSGFAHEDRLVGAFRTADFASSVRLLDAVAIEADAANHHPDVRLGWGRVEFALTSHDVGGVTRRDVDLALRIGAVAAALDAEPA